jgi:uncharacterized protein (DUF1697 family)
MDPMSKTLAFLRGMNIGGHRAEMSEIKRIFEGIGFTEVETFIASGNVIFEAGKIKTPRLKIEAALEKALGYEVQTFLRSAEEVAAIAAFKPFPEAVMAQAKSLVVGLHESQLGEAASKALKVHETGSDHFRVHGREVYWLSFKGQSGSDFFKVGFEKVLKQPSTTRSLTTMGKLAAKYPA